MRPEYEIINGIKYAIIWRKKGYDKTNKCPFCNTEHIHGSLEGHRIPHCSDVNVRKEGYGISTLDGSFLLQSNGYIIREY